MIQPQPLTLRERRKILRTHKVLIKDLERYIDYLIGYRPAGTHWKRAYYERKKILDEVLASENTPPEIRGKIAAIQETIYSLQNKIEHTQWYFPESLDDYRKNREIQVNDNMNGNRSYYI